MFHGDASTDVYPPNPQASVTLSPGVTGGTNGASASKSGAASARRTDWAAVIHRSLRGKYRFTISMSLLCALVAGLAGWKWAGPLFRSEGMVRIASALPAVIQQTDQSQPIPMFDSFMQTQQGLVTSRPILDAAVAETIWNAQAGNYPRLSAEELAAGLIAEARPRSENLKISFTYSNPVVAQAAVAATISAYQKIFEQDNEQMESQRMQLLVDYRNKLAAQLQLAQPATQPAVAEAQSPDTQPVIQAEIPLPPSPEKIGMTDPMMRHLLDDRDTARDNLDRATMYYGENSAAVQRTQVAYDQASQRVQRYLEDYVAFHESAPVVERPVERFAQGPTTAPVQQLAAAPLSASMQQIQNELDEADRRIEVLKAEAAMPKRLEIVSAGDFPIAVPGRQMKVTAVCLAAGGGLPVGIMILLGLLRRRFDYCADVTDALCAKSKFVAAVPQLDAAADAGRMEDAAYCVHRLRQTLEQNSNVYLVTSADWGEGRTSLAMSLGLSLAGSGASTVVVDADLLARGLTLALDLTDGPGFVELLDHGDLSRSLRMANNGLAILPVGQASEADGLSISATSLTDMLNRLREVFDVILIDAGPVLSRVEACVIARQVDGVLLTVGRGTKKDLVAKAMEELELVNANVIGTVFNGAERRDFYQSMQRRRPASAIAPAPVATPEVLKNFGPLVAAVAASLKRGVDLSFAAGKAGRTVRRQPPKGSGDHGQLRVA